MNVVRCKQDGSFHLNEESIGSKISLVFLSATPIVHDLWMDYVSSYVDSYIYYVILKTSDVHSEETQVKAFYVTTSKRMAYNIFTEVNDGDTVHFGIKTWQTRGMTFYVACIQNKS